MPMTQLSKVIKKFEELKNECSVSEQYQIASYLIRNVTHEEKADKQLGFFDLIREMNSAYVKQLNNTYTNKDMEKFRNEKQHDF